MLLGNFQRMRLSRKYSQRFLRVTIPVWCKEQQILDHFFKNYHWIQLINNTDFRRFLRILFSVWRQEEQILNIFFYLIMKFTIYDRNMPVGNFQRMIFFRKDSQRFLRVTMSVWRQEEYILINVFFYLKFNQDPFFSELTIGISL